MLPDGDIYLYVLAHGRYIMRFSHDFADETKRERPSMHANIIIKLFPFLSLSHDIYSSIVF